MDRVARAVPADDTCCAGCFYEEDWHFLQWGGMDDEMFGRQNRMEG